MQDGIRRLCMKQDRVNQQCDARDMKEALASDIQMSGTLVSITIEITIEITSITIIRNNRPRNVLADQSESSISENCIIHLTKLIRSLLPIFFW